LLVTWLTPPARGSSESSTEGKPTPVDNAGLQAGGQGTRPRAWSSRCTPAPAACASSTRLLRGDFARRDQGTGA